MKKLCVFLASLLFVGIQMVQAQTVRITGTVTSSEDGMPLPGVSVIVKGTTIGGATDANGKYEINAPTNAQFLTISFIGFKVQDVAIGGRAIVDVALESESIQVQEVVVTALGIKRNPKELGVATVKVSAEEITSSGATNVMNALSAKVSGLQINTVNNGVNPDTKITLRGNRHFLASNQALVILDGVPVNATILNSVNPNDIENVNVLKGASASALYGNEASNGVLIVTTKKGTKQKPTIRFSNTTTFESISYLPNLQERFGAGSSETPENSDPNYTFFIGPDRNTDPYTSYENQCYGPEFNGQMVILGGKLVDGSYQMVPYKAVKNQKKNFFDTGVTSQFDISYTAGDDNSNIYISGQNVNSTGTVPGDKNRRSGVRMAAGKKYGKFGADFTIGFTNTLTNTSGGDMNQDRGVYWNVLNTPAHVPLTKYKDIDTNPFATLDGYFNAYYPNPYWQIEHSRQIYERNDLLGSLTLNFKANDWFEISNRTGVNYNARNYDYYKDEAIYNSYSKADPWSQGHMGVTSPYSSNAGNSMRTSFNLTNDLFAKIDKEFGDFSVKFLTGTSLYSAKINFMSQDASALVIPEFYNISNRVGEPVVGQSLNERNSIGLFGDATLGYKKFAFVHMSARNDWDSRLVKENRSFFYPGADFSLVLSEMLPAIKDGGLVNFLKVRASWSKTGQIALGNWYATQPSYVAAAGFPYGSTAGFRVSTTLSNPTLKPEITNETEAGFEISLLDSKINFTANLYKSVTKDQTIPATISSTTGYYSAYINAGELETRGIETDLKLIPINSLNGLTWNLTFNYSYSTSEVLSIFPGLSELPVSDGVNTSSSYAVIGEQFPAIRVTDVLRDPSGRIIVDPVTGLPKKNPELIIAGHGTPNHIFGIVNNVSYKGLSLNVVAEYRGGNVIYNAVGNALDFTGVSEHSALNGRQPFVIPNSVLDNGDGTFTQNSDVLVTNASRPFWVNSDYHNTQRAYVTSAAFWKLREVALSYVVPVDKLFGDKVIKGAEVSLVGRNLLMFRPATNVWTDPEFNNSDVNSNAVGLTTEDQTPPTRIFGFSVKLTF